MAKTDALIISPGPFLLILVLVETRTLIEKGALRPLPKFLSLLILSQDTVENRHQELEATMILLDQHRAIEVPFHTLLPRFSARLDDRPQPIRPPAARQEFPEALVSEQDRMILIAQVCLQYE